MEEIKLSEQEIVNIKKEIYQKYVEYIDKKNRNIIEELLIYKFNSECENFIKNHTDELVVGNEEYIVSTILLNLTMFINSVSDDISDQQIYLNIFS